MTSTELNEKHLFNYARVPITFIDPFCLFHDAGIVSTSSFFGTGFSDGWILAKNQEITILLTEVRVANQHIVLDHGEFVEIGSELESEGYNFLTQWTSYRDYPKRHDFLDNGDIDVEASSFGIEGIETPSQRSPDQRGGFDGPLFVKATGPAMIVEAIMPNQDGVIDTAFFFGLQYNLLAIFTDGAIFAFLPIKIVAGETFGNLSLNTFKMVNDAATSLGFHFSCFADMQANRPRWSGHFHSDVEEQKGYNFHEWA